MHNAIVKGHHSFTIDKIKGDLDGDLSADVSIETKSGPFAINDGKADITLNTLEIGDGQMVLKESMINGKVEISPVVFKENKGVKILKFLTLDTDIKAQMGNLDFLDIYLHSIEEMQLDGKGLLSGHINFDKGVLLSGTELKVDADELSVAMLDHEVKGNGEVELNVMSANPDELNVKVLFDDLQAYYSAAEETKRGAPLFSGKGLLVEAKGVPSLFPKSSKDEKVSYLGIEIPSVRVEDLGQFQRYIPEKLNYKLYGGEGTLKAKANLLANSFKSKVQVQSTGAHIGIDKQHLQSDLDLLLNLDAEYKQKFSVDLSGSYLSLTNSKLFNREEADNKALKPWNTEININKGILTLPFLTELNQDANHTQKPSKKVHMQQIKEWLKESGSQLGEKDELLKFLTLDVDIKAHIGNLDFLNIYLDSVKDMQLYGEGLVDGHINFDKGVLLSGTELNIDANKLSLTMLDHTVEGNGRVDLNVTKAKSDKLNVEILFDDLRAYYGEVERNATKAKRGVPLFSGNGLSVKASGTPSLFPKSSDAEKITYLTMDIPSVKVEDLGQYQRYIPEKWAFKLYEGSGELHAKAALEKEHVSFNLQLLSKEAKVGFSKQIFKSDLDLLLKFDATSGKAFKADMSGSYLSLKDSVIVDGSGKKKKTSKNWDTHLNIDESIFTMPLDENKNLSREDLRSMDKLDMKKLLSTADATLKVTGMISQFDWLNLLMKNSLNLDFEGQGEVKADLKLKQGFLTSGSKISVIPKDLQVGLLDYTFLGDGEFFFNVTQGGENPSMKFALSLNDAQMKRRNEKQAMIEHVDMKLDGEINNINFKKAQKEIDLHLQIPSAKVKNIAIYNSYIPKNSPFKLTSGTANMSADILLSSNNAKGYVKLKTNGLTMQADDQKISARLNMDVKIQGGVPKNMAFNIAGSTIVLDQAKVIGSTTAYKQPDWSARVKLKKANVVWRKPIKLKSETTLHIKDSRPVVAMMDNKRDKHNWLSKLMTIENINGVATVNMQNNVITFPYAFVKSDKIDIGAKGIISEALRDGVFYLRYKGLKTLLKIRNGKKNLDIFHVEKTFNNYVIPSIAK